MKLTRKTISTISLAIASILAIHSFFSAVLEKERECAICAIVGVVFLAVAVALADTPGASSKELRQKKS